MVANSSRVKHLIKILIGAAWLDGRIQPEERQYLRQIAEEKGISDDPDIRPFLYELVPVQPTQCYQWVQEYIGDNPTTEESQNLMEAISGLIYSDGEVAIEEARLLTKLEQLSDKHNLTQPAYSNVLKQIQKLYRRWVQVQN